MKVLMSVSFLQRFCTQRFNVSGRGMLRKSDFISKLATENEASNSKTSSANEKGPLIYILCL